MGAFFGGFTMGVPTRFINGGVTTVPKTDLLGDFGHPDPMQWISFFDDFTINTGIPIGTSGIADNANWDVTITEGGGSDCSVAFADGLGGLLLITNDAADDDAAFFRKK